MGKKKKKHELDDVDLVFEKSSGDKKKKKKKKGEAKKEKKKKDKKKKNKDVIALSNENVGCLMAEVVPDIGLENYDEAIEDTRTVTFVVCCEDQSIIQTSIVVRTPNKSFVDIISGKTVANIAKEKGASKTFKSITKFRPIFISEREFIDGFVGGKYK